MTEKYVCICLTPYEAELVTEGLKLLGQACGNKASAGWSMKSHFEKGILCITTSESIQKQIVSEKEHIKVQAPSTSEPEPVQVKIAA